MDGGGSISELFQQNSSCFDYDKCFLQFKPCDEIHENHRYNDASAVWILISAIIVFFMKAGFLQIELAFSDDVDERRHVVVVKHLDVFASAFGFFLFGFDYVSGYINLPQGLKPHHGFFQISDPILWFFKFTFASNAATIIGGCLVTNKYKLRLPAAFLSSFVISGIIHPLIARFIWNRESPLSVFKFCNNETTADPCDTTLPFQERMYILDFAGGGAVHLVGGVAGLVLCLFAKLHNYRVNRKPQQKKRKRQQQQQQEEKEEEEQHTINGETALVAAREQAETISQSNFWQWMYPVNGGGESINEAALGVLILWFCWLVCLLDYSGNVEYIHSELWVGLRLIAGLLKVLSLDKTSYSYHAIPSIIAINMILAASSGGILSVIIASRAQMWLNSGSVNANEIANGILSSLVAITAGCPFVDFWAACLIGVVAVVVYHIGCWLEYKLGIEDTARVVPVHGLCGLWSLIAVGVFITNQCNLHATFEGLCYCHLRLPHLNYGERFAAQLIGALIMIAITASICFVMYGVLYLIPLELKSGKITDCYNRFMSWLLKSNDDHCWLFTGLSGTSRKMHPKNTYSSIGQSKTRGTIYSELWRKESD